MNPKPIEESDNPWLAATPEAMRLARQDAEDLAIATGTALILFLDGKIVRFYPGRNATEDGQPVVTPPTTDT